MNLKAKAVFAGKNFAVFETALVAKLLVGAEAAANVVLAESQSLVPRDTGELAASGNVTLATMVKSQHVTSYVSYDAAYAAFLEFGTGNMGRGTYPYDLPQTGVPITGSWIYDYKQQNWHGMRSQAFLRPALDTGRAGALDAFKACLAV
jgi:HK97 gp10 family phage protein